MKAKEDLVEQLLAFPATHPYAKWTGSPWRLVEVADSAVPVAEHRLKKGVDAELAWLLPGLAPHRVLRVAGRVRHCGSMKGNEVYALSRLGYADHPGTQELVGALLDWQWPDGGWTCDKCPAYWHYDVLQGLRLLAAVGRLHDPRAGDALDVVERSRRRDGRFSGRSWATRRQPAAVDWGHGTDNLMLNEIATSLLEAAGRPPDQTSEPVLNPVPRTASTPGSIARASSFRRT